VWYWELARLFRFYERGAIFASKTIHCIKVLGVLCVLNWILYGIACALSWPPKAYGPSFFEIKTISSAHIFHMGFFSFDFGTGIDFGTLAAGIAIVLIAWIMDEGRKIQEEQELTV
jgi:hypothetical protein